jgi:hypothetical protein
MHESPDLRLPFGHRRIGDFSDFGTHLFFDLDFRWPFGQRDLGIYLGLGH